MFEFRNLRLKTNPYVDIRKLRNNRRYILDYEYEDWEDRKPDLYDDLFTASKIFSTATTSTIRTTSSSSLSPTVTTIDETGSTSETTTSIQTTFEDTTPSTIPTTLNGTTTAISTNTAEAISVTTPKLIETSSTEASLEIKSLEISPISDTPIAPEVTTTSVLSSDTSVTMSVQETTTVLTTTSSMTTSVTTMSLQTTIAEIATTDNPFVTEIKNEKNKLRSGYFSASLVVILRAIVDKEPTQLLSLMAGFHGVVLSMISNHEFEFLGWPVVNMFTEVNDLMIQQYPGVVQGVAQETVLWLQDRRRFFEPDTNAIMDVVDTIYNDEDVTNIAAVLDHLKRFPATDKTAEEISREGLQALVFTPWGRVAGDPRQRLLQMELDAAIQRRVPTRPGRRHGVTSKKMYSKNYLRTRNIMNTSTETTYEYQYVKNATIMKRLKKRMSSYVVKMRSIRLSEWRVPTRRGPTTTTTATVRTTMHKSKYYRMKKVKKNLRRRKNVTTTTTKFKWRYYGKVKRLKKVPYRKFEYYNIQRKTENSCESKNYNITHHTQCSSVEKTDFDKTMNSDSNSYYSETDSSYEEKNTTVESNSLETLTRLGKSGESFKSYGDSKMEDYDKYIQTSYKSNYERRDVKINHQDNWKALEQYASKKGFETKVSRCTEYSKRDYVDNKRRKYISDLKLKEPYTNINSFGSSKRNRNRFRTSIYKRNRVCSIKMSTRPTQIKHPIIINSVKNNKRFTKPNVSRYDRNNIKRNDLKNILNTKWYDKIRLNDIIRNYSQKIMNIRATNNKYNDKNDRNNDRFNTIKLHKSRGFHTLGKKPKLWLKYQKVVNNSDSINDERVLKANLEDAMFHREDLREKLKNRRNLEEKVNKFQLIDSISDDEVKIKGRIYKVLGLGENFGKQLRTIH